MTTVGFLGLGSMGSAIAGRLIEKGQSVRVWNRTPAGADDLVAAGALRADSAAEALAEKVSFSMLADDEAAEAVLSVESIGSGEGRIHVNTASISPAAADRLAARFAEAGVAYVASPVLGRPVVAAAGELNLLVAGPDAAVETVAQYLDIIGKRTWRFGEEPRKANAVKVAVNYNLLHAIETIGESIALVERQGVDPGEFVEVLTNTLFAGVAYSGYGREIATRAYDPPGFGMHLALKDLGLAEELAREGQFTLPTAGALRAVFERALADPTLAGLDWGAVAEVSRRDKS